MTHTIPLENVLCRCWPMDSLSDKFFIFPLLPRSAEAYQHLKHLVPDGTYHHVMYFKVPAHHVSLIGAWKRITDRNNAISDYGLAINSSLFQL